MQGINKNCMFLSKDEADRVELYLPKREDLKKMSQIFSALSATTRLKIVCALSIKSACVTDLQNLLGINQTTLSHQLAFLKREGVVDCKRKGKAVVYYVCSPSSLRILSACVDFIEENKGCEDTFYLD